MGSVEGDESIEFEIPAARHAGVVPRGGTGRRGASLSRLISMALLVHRLAARGARGRARLLPAPPSGAPTAPPRLFPANSPLVQGSSLCLGSA